MDALQLPLLRPCSWYSPYLMAAYDPETEELQSVSAGRVASCFFNHTLLQYLPLQCIERNLATPKSKLRSRSL